ncbi:hypothetical protein AGR13a_Lc30100 [Agrobacterium genomosp. 13 str. CFBP 6927]|uniref:Uncharacterized protein n=1 Tax=Agrobacterium genomosp. 13 str. CFBP 6927 TaxID=1183428 RepID=A0ABP2BMU1_9HYPH|nr:hypothetical protein AGR13a_Lc30100 [Agrobacterium genomosp. 13 str. CFBP 6927]
MDQPIRMRRVKFFMSGTNTEHSPTCQALRHSSRVTDGEKQYYLSPSIWIKNAAIAEMLREQGTYLVLAQPDSLKPNKNYYNLHVTLSSKHQICRY